MTTFSALLIHLILVLVKTVEEIAIKTNNFRLADQCITVRDAMREAGWVP